MKPYGYKLYKKHKEYHNNDYASIKAIQDIYKQEYSKIEDSNVLTTLLINAEREQFRKDSFSMGIKSGLVGALAFLPIELFVLQPILNQVATKASIYHGIICALYYF